MYILFLSLFCLVIILSLLTFAITKSHSKSTLEEKVDNAFKQTQVYENIYPKAAEPELPINAKAQEIVFNIGEAQVVHGQSIEAMDVTKKEISRCVEVYKSTQQKPVELHTLKKPVLRVIENNTNK
ncbi:hypothetical protein [Pseudoalteromonas luteoviolacea]|uniref:Uncharacterized protein n=1 Tax=Pseudoalteromonas luteoviolacea NCIMB 1942 TaxID=1365253 RepID=A0A166Z8E5_9GAMM|nr:hypothetical protein [Pseudoalteromonas luteoviolacea]KZN44048.1 hypothetical protein N482_18145 [Pseudoalteromonas luteoviolacea NCIMB 1942]